MRRSSRILSFLSLLGLPLTWGCTTLCVDDDGDGYATSLVSCDAGAIGARDTPDCDDANSAINPGADEVCDEVDNNCDGQIDEGVPTWYADNDSDDYGEASTAVFACSAPDGYVADGTDCDDANSAINPGADEVCGGVDSNCDGFDDDYAIDETVWYADDDSDGYGDASTAVAACSAPDGYVADGTDCDDDDARFNPGATEDCTDDNDFNCDGSVEYANLDGDEFAACEECNDNDAAIHPWATEVCDGVDNDCDGDIDEDDAYEVTMWYADADADGYGDASSTTSACDQPSG